MFVDRAGADLDTEFGPFRIEVFKDREDREHLALIRGDVSGPEPVLTRLHSECVTGDALFSTHCDCGHQLAAAMAAISREERGLLLYLRQEGRGIGLTAKIKAYVLQQQEGLDTFAANERLGLKADAREYQVAVDMLNELQVNRVRLLTGNPGKVQGLEQEGIEVSERVDLKLEDLRPQVQRYLKDKREIGGHIQATSSTGD